MTVFASLQSSSNNISIWSALINFPQMILVNFITQATSLNIFYQMDNQCPTLFSWHSLQLSSLLQYHQLLFRLIEATLTPLTTKILDLLPSNQTTWRNQPHNQLGFPLTRYTGYKSTGLVLNVLELTELFLQQRL